jgi:hypothetical protein
MVLRENVFRLGANELDGTNLARARPNRKSIVLR